MADPLHLIGFKHSVYTWVVRLALAEMGMTAEYTEANPFADPPDPVLQEFTPLRRVPVLRQGAMVLTETAAILRFLDGQGDAQSMQPKDRIAQARMTQIIGLVDADIYPHLIRKVFSHGFYRPLIEGAKAEAGEVAAGLLAATPALGLLESIAQEGHQLGRGPRSLADLHLAPMLSYACRVPQLADTLPRYPALFRWWQEAATWEGLRATDPLASLTARR